MMKEDSRFLIGKHIYRVDLQFGTINQVGNADNKISISQLLESSKLYRLWLDAESGAIKKGIQEENTLSVSIPKSILEIGYSEGSKFAENFNAKLSEKYGIQLMDKDVLNKILELPIPFPQPNLPIIEKNGYQLEVDVSLREIRRVDQPFVHLKFDHADVENGKYIGYMFDEGKLSALQMDGTTKLEFDQMVRLDPEGIAKLYGIPKEKLPESDDQLISNPIYIQDRIDRGKLPVIRIVDEDYYVDTRLGELRACSKFWKTIKVSNDWVDVDPNPVFLYDYLNREIIKDYMELTEFPKHSVFVVLPDLITMDPVAAGRETYKDTKAYLNQYPVQPFMEARVVPIEKTFLLEQIKTNMKNKIQMNGEKVKPPAHKRNKGLSK